MSAPVPAYLVASSFMPEGHGSLMPYFESVHPLLEKYGVELLVAGHSGQPMVMLEGGWPEDAKFTLMRFKSMEDLLSFWNSPEYQEIKHLRTEVIPPNFTFAVGAYEDDEVVK